MSYFYHFLAVPVKSFEQLSEVDFEVQDFYPSIRSRDQISIRSRCRGFRSFRSCIDLAAQISEPRSRMHSDSRRRRIFTQPSESHRQASQSHRHRSFTQRTVARSAPSRSGFYPAHRQGAPSGRTVRTVTLGAPSGRAVGVPLACRWRAVERVVVAGTAKGRRQHPPPPCRGRGGQT